MRHNSLPIDNKDQNQGTFSIAHETLRTFIYDYRVTWYSTETVDQALELLRNPSVNDIDKINTAWERSFFARRELPKKTVRLAQFGNGKISLVLHIIGIWYTIIIDLEYLLFKYENYAYCIV